MVTLSLKEQNRLQLLNEIERRHITGKEAAAILSLSLRHFRRVLAAYRREGAAALAHGNRGHKPAHAVGGDIKGRVLTLARTKYAGFNTQHFTEMLEDQEGIKLSRSTVRRVLLSGGVKGPRKRSAPRHRSRRERFPQEGLLLQIDASHHDWLEGRGPRMALVGAIDDATGRVVHAIFREQEDSLGYFLLLRHILATDGAPHALYHDGHSIFEVTPSESQSIEAQLQGRQPRTQFGRLLDELGITSIRSRSPQARGRVERLWGTFQDRLSSELRLAKASTLEEANRLLTDYLPRHNSRFTIPAREPGLSFLNAPVCLDNYFCFKYDRMVGLDNVVSLGNRRLQLLPTGGRYSFARAKVEVHEHLDGALSVHYQGQRLHTQDALPEAAGLRNTAPPPHTGRNYAKPSPAHPWRGKYRQFIDKSTRG